MTDITELAQSLKRRAASANEFGEGLFFIKADDVLALVEALEKVQSRDVTQAAKDYHFDQQADRIAELDAELEREREKTRRVMSRIAELESRTVKLPKPISVLHRRDSTDAHRAIYAYPEAEVNAALDESGIKWEAE